MKTTFTVLPEGNYITLSLGFGERNVPKDLWYRISEREHVPTRLLSPEQIALRMKDWRGPNVSWSRSVAHVGYWLTPTEMPAQDLERLTRWAALDNVNRALKARMPLQNAPATDLLSIVDDQWMRKIRLDLDSPEPPADPLTFEQLVTVFMAMGLNLHRAFSNIRHQLRGLWWREHQNTIAEGNRNIRTIWYFDHPPVKGWIETAKGRALAVVGKREEGWSDYENPYESQPPSFDQWTRQNLYYCQPHGNYDIPNHSGYIRVHPLDITLLDEPKGEPNESTNAGTGSAGEGV